MIHRINRFQQSMIIREHPSKCTERRHFLVEASLIGITRNSFPDKISGTLKGNNAPFHFQRLFYKIAGRVEYAEYLQLETELILRVYNDYKEAV